MTDILYTIGKTVFCIVVSRYVIRSVLNMIFSTKSLTPEEIEQIKLSVESESHAKEAQIITEVKFELDNLDY